jgi:molybdopterin-guanine dinucleotide biosynthesis protein A
MRLTSFPPQSVTHVTAAGEARVLNGRSSDLCESGREEETALLTGVILAGGAPSGTNGQPKALWLFGGEKMILRQLRLMQPACSELIVVTNDPKPYLRLLAPEIRIITDFVPNRGPLGGMHAGLSLARNRDVWIVGSHMPFVSAKAAELLLERKRQGFAAALPAVKGSVHPLHGVYDRSCAERIWPLLQTGETKLSRLLADIHWGGLGDAAFRDAGAGLDFSDCFGTQADYEHMLRQLADSGQSQSETSAL